MAVVGSSGGRGKDWEAMLLPELRTKEFAACIPDWKDFDLSTLLCGSRIVVGYSYPDIRVPFSVPVYYWLTVKNALLTETFYGYIVHLVTS